MALCRSCGAQINWIKTTNGKNMPVDAEGFAWDEPPAGSLVVDLEGNVKRTTGNLDDDDGREWFQSHFTTCPNADEWRTKKESSAKKGIREQASKQKALQWGNK